MHVAPTSLIEVKDGVIGLVEMSLHYLMHTDFYSSVSIASHFLLAAVLL